MGDDDDVKKQYCAASIPEDATNTDCLTATAVKTMLTISESTPFCISSCTSEPSDCNTLTDSATTGCAKSCSDAVKSGIWAALVYSGKITCSCADPGAPTTTTTTPAGSASGGMQVGSSKYMVVVAMTMPLLAMAH